jgi:signal peptide peptidase SppA
VSFIQAFLASRPWAALPDRLTEWARRCESLVALVQAGLSPMQRARAAISGESTISTDVANGVATVHVSGVLMDAAPWWAKIDGEVTDMAELRAELARLATDKAVDRVVLAIDSPGGSAAGLSDTVSAISALAAMKPVVAHIAGMAASAAYFLASATDEIVASPDALIGSIGTFAVLTDTSGLQEKIGVRFSTVTSAPGKGLGADGRVSDAMREQWQRIVDRTAAVFVDQVAAGRGMTKDEAKALATGDVWLADEALAKGLIDRVASSATAAPAKTATTSAAGTPPVASNAGTEPAPSPDTPAGTDPMKITAAVLAALVLSAPEHAAMISAMASGDPAKGIQPGTEDEIRAAITTAKAKSLNDRIAALEAKATADAAANTAALAAKDAQIAALQAKADKGDKVLALAAGAAKDPGADHVGANVSASDKLKAEWDGLSAEQQMGFCNDFDGFKAWKANAHRDRAASAAAASADKTATATPAAKKEG